MPYLPPPDILNILVIKPSRCTDFSNLFFGIKLYMFRTVSLSHYQQFFTVHTAMLCVIRVCWQLARGISSSVLILLASSMTYTIAVCTEETTDDGQRNCPKHVEFYSENKLEKLVNPVFKLSANLYDIYHCCVYNENLLMMGRGTVRNM